MSEPAVERFSRVIDDDRRHWSLRLYVAGAAPISQRAVANLKAICEELLPGRYDIEVVDVFQRPDLTAQEQVTAVPTLLRLLPRPVARVVGDLSDRAHVLAGLDLVQEG